MMNVAFDFTAVIDRWPELMWGTFATFGLSLSGMILALVIGVVGVAIRSSRRKVLSGIVIVFVEVVRNTPFLVQIFFIFFALPLAGLRLNPTVTAILALGLNGGAYAIEIIRGGVESISKGQSEAGRALGLKPRQVFRLIVLRPALRAIYPSLTSQFVLLTLSTSIVTSISAFELTSVAQRIESDTFRSFEVYLTITAIYLAVSLLMMLLFKLIARIAFHYPVR